MIGIYKITSPSNRIYIGQSVNIEKRIKYYKYGYSVKQRRLNASLNKYGYDNHIFEIVQECEKSELQERERYWQEYYNVLGEKGLNCELTTCNNFRRELSLDSKKLISIKNKGENNGMYGHKHSEEFKQERREYKHSKESILKISKHSQKGNNPMSKIVLCKVTGVYYDCIGDAAESLNIPYDRLKQWLNGSRKNKSSMTFI
jgi:group I intron endonuclease